MPGRARASRARTVAVFPLPEAPVTTRIAGAVIRCFSAAEHVLDATACTRSCTGDFPPSRERHSFGGGACKSFHDPRLMKAELRISIKQYRGNEKSEIVLLRTPF